MGSYMDDDFLDAIIVGGGFGGCYLLQNLRKSGFRVRVFEEGHGLGGVWWHNRYPGARVDNNTPFYEFSDPELWTEWEWSEAYPGQKEIVEYFKFVDRKWNLSQDITFGTKVTDATWDAARGLWTIQTDKGHVVSARHLLLSMGFASKKYIPHLNGLETFEGLKCHTADWPARPVDWTDKRVAVMGTGATGVQVIQELGPKVGKLVVLQRSPNCALPMRQKAFKQPVDKSKYAELFRTARLSQTGSDNMLVDRRAKDDTHDQRIALYETLWARGGFAPVQANYFDFMTDLDANHSFYRFWRDQVRQRLTRNDSDLIENLAPENPPYPFGTKRPSLEQTFYEVFNQDNVELVPLKKTPISRIVPNGIELENGITIKVDALILATGFDAVTGGFSRVNIRGAKNKSLRGEWADGARTCLGMATSGFPNLFYQYGPQSPTAFASGPLISEIQADWIIATMVYMREHGFSKTDAKPEMEEEWSCITNEACYQTLMSHNETTWYMGGNVPGKKREALGYIGGLPKYQEYLKECVESRWSSFVFQ
ncbi:FAD/NAD(P)-binding domain-containing protein [Aspergillus campestris IBT 28561]|uniref:FAD/NAD(P)-binding domain-containing protein n=1 Tax=Aspergillus campestris (strain IBT 28561) TaxID=1392248 RepID=A0A2I1CYK1_ASPC2|nr:FAD/NAD(P)-binding domain-containing protein [Aspergillus campestris IBT 28561]PKY02694.1 FAD/NAD(P)-binding domain-containing protein [Aspergillus campestris IBT 28561]